MTNAAYAFPADVAHEQARLRWSHGRTYGCGNQCGAGTANDRAKKTNGNAPQLAATAILDEMAIWISDDDYECLCALLATGVPTMDAIRMAVFDDVDTKPRGNKFAALTGRIWT
jgi:hypothetical protein